MSISAIGNTLLPGAAASTSSSLSAANNTAAPASDTASGSVANASYYTSPVLTTDTVTGALILEYRDPTTGNELYQQPSRIAQEYRQAQQLGAKK